jgi:hypothetical protein
MRGNYDMNIIHGIANSACGAVSAVIWTFCCFYVHPSLAAPPTASLDILNRYQVCMGDRGWEAAAWTGDDRPFATARASIDGVFKSKGDLSPQLTQYETLAKKHPHNPLDQFLWAYAFYVQGSIPHAVMRDVSAPIVAMAGARQPQTYEYARLRFLYQRLGIDDREIAERLLARKHDDCDVLEDYAALLSQSRSKEDDELAVKTIQNVVNKGQGVPGSEWIMAGVYANVGFLESNPDYYKKSIEANNSFLKLTPSYDWRRAAALHSIDVLQRRLNGSK